MTKNYTNLISNIKNRTNPDSVDESILLEKSYRDELNYVSNKKVLEYIKRAMKGVEPRYTERTIEAGNKVKQHLINENDRLDYHFQGSVMTNTHIKGHSDIDLVQITNSFYFPGDKNQFRVALESFLYNQSQKSRIRDILNANSYTGSEKHNLYDIRVNAEKRLQDNYKYVDISKPKSIEVKPTNPSRIVDVVTASWYKNLESVVNNDKTERGIRIYDKGKNEILPVDFPFKKIKLVNEKDKNVNGRLKKMIRFIKNIKIDSEYNIDLNSFEITSICYDISINKYSDKSYLELVGVIYEQFKKLYSDYNYRNNLMSVDKTEYVFRGKDEKLNHLRQIVKELEIILNDVLSNNSNLMYPWS